ncbi:MAG: PadR family transcriptional regulator [Bacilli bacterium]
MDPQIKKGSLEMCILMILNQADGYGYEVSKTVGSLLEVKEGTIYLVLQRLEKTNLISSYLLDSDSKRVRKYYRITLDGVLRMEQLIEDYNTINNVIKKLMNKTQGGDISE